MKRKRVFCVMMTFLLCMNFGFPAFAAEVNEDVFSVSILPNESQEANSISINQISQEPSPLEMEITLSSYEYIHNTVVETAVHVSWDDEETWDTTLRGNAYIYNNNDQLVVIGSVRGYNNEMSDSSFVGLDYTYDVNSQKCIATATYNYADDGSCDMMSFGNNTGEFNQAILASLNVSESMPTERIGAGLQEEASVQSENIDYVSEYIAEVYTRGGALQYDVWTYPEMRPRDTNKIAASVKGDVTAAEDYILDLQPTAYSITPRYCDFFFACDSAGAMSTAEYLPKEHSTKFDIPFSLPLVGGQSLPINLSFTFSSVDVTDRLRQTTWEVYNLNGIDGLAPGNPNGVGFYNLYYFDGDILSGEEAQIYMQAHGSIGYSYVYVDAEAGGLNNSTWYAMQSSSARIHVYN